MLKVRSITTKVGDRGKTRLFSGEEVYKNSSRPSAYGDLDELVSVLGVARCSARRKDVRGALLELQRELFVVASELATTARHRAALEKRVDAAMLAKMEQRRSTLERRIRMPAGFIIPGATPGQQPTISWPVLPGKSYRLQSKSALTDGAWQDIIGGITILGSKGYFQDPAPAPDQRFYRVVAF